LVGAPPLDPLANEFLGVDDIVLEIAVLGVRAGFHGAHRAHAPVLLEPFALVQHDIAGALVDTGEHAAEHHRVGTGGERFGDITGELHTTVAHDAGVVTLDGPGGVGDRGELGNTDPGHDPGGAYGARADTDLDRGC